MFTGGILNVSAFVLCPPSPPPGAKLPSVKTNRIKGGKKTRGATTSMNQSSRNPWKHFCLLLLVAHVLLEWDGLEHKIEMHRVASNLSPTNPNLPLRRATWDIVLETNRGGRIHHCVGHSSRIIFLNLVRNVDTRGMFLALN